MGRNAKVAMAAAFRTAEGTYPRHEILFKNGRPWRCRLNADSPAIAIPESAAFYVTHAKGANLAKPATRATPLAGNLEDAFNSFRQFEANFQRRKQGLNLLEDFTTNKPTAAPGSRVSIADATTKYLLRKKTAGKSKATIDAYRLALDGFKSSCKWEYLDELTEDDLFAYLAWMQANVKRRSVGQRAITFRKRLGFVLTFLKEHGITGIWKAANTPKIVKKAPDKYDDETIAAILKTATPEERMRLLFFFYTGCRDMEVATAQYSDIDRRTGIFTVQAKPHLGWKPKTSEEREQVLPASFVKELMERKEHSKNELIFPCVRSGKVDNNLIEFLQKAAKRAGITERVTLHKIRRTAISHAIKKFGVTNAMKFAGHSDIATTNKYAAADDMTSPKVRKAVEAAMAELVGD